MVISPLIFSLLFSPVFAVSAASPSFSLYPTNPRQGEAAMATLVSDALPTSATFGGKPASILKYKDKYRVVFGVGANQQSGTYNLRVYFENGSKIVSPIVVKSKKFPRLVLGIPEKLKVTPKELVVKLSDNNKVIMAAAESSPPEARFTGGFALPLVNNLRLTSIFGEIRVTGSQEIRHNGIDLGAKLGAGVAAMNDGVVNRAYADDIYGNSVIVDHGAGIISLYMHLDKILVKEGESIKRGKLVGLAGKTGYAEFPHLHLSTKINGVSVDPLSLLRIF